MKPIVRVRGMTGVLTAAATLVLSLSVTNASYAQEVEADRIAAQLATGVRGNFDLPTAELRAARRAMLDGRTIPYRTMRQIADYGDGFAALSVAKYLEDLERDDLVGDVAHYYSISLETARPGAIHGYLRSLQVLDPQMISKARLDRLEQTLLAYARAGNTIALSGAIALYRDGHPFRAEASVLAELERLKAESAGPAEKLTFAQHILLQQAPSQEQIQSARRTLTSLLEADDPVLKLRAETLIAQMFALDLATQIEAAQ